MALQVGDTIGPYTIEGTLGAGGMATVYKGYHPRLDRSVAIKVLHRSLQTNTDFQQRFEREARIVARLEHPNIVPVYDFSEYQGEPYLVMKYIEGETLKKSLSGTPLPKEMLHRLVMPIASALTYAHEHGVLHRDVKPSNVLIDMRGTPYLTDFGLARLAVAGESTMSADVMLGTPFYISPEQARGERELDARTDIYSLGIVLYEMVVGRVPFAADTAYATVHDHIYTAPPLPSELNPAVNPTLEAVLLKALAKQPDARYSSAVALAQAFLAALDGETDDRPVSAAARPAAPPASITEADTQSDERPASAADGSRRPASRSRIPPPPPVPPLPAAPRRPSAPRPPERGRAAEDFGERMEQMDEKAREWSEKAGEWGEKFGEQMARWGEQVGENIKAAMHEESAGRKSIRLTWRPGAKWVNDGPHGPGFYTDDDLMNAEMEDGMDEDEARIRRRITEKIEERQGLIGHAASYVGVNLMLWAIWLFNAINAASFPFPWPLLVTLGWGMGLFAHGASYWSEYGPGRERREALIQREIERERARLGYKAKNDDLYDSAVSRVRLNEEGELTDSFVDELDAREKRKRRDE